MKIVNPSVEILRTGYETDFMTPEQFIEKVGRTCYKSEDKIAPDSAPKFVHNLINRGHEAMIEHWTLIFRARSDTVYEQIWSDWQTFNEQSFKSTNPVADDSFMPKIRFTADYGIDRFIISGNIRAWRDFIRGYMRNNKDSIMGFMFEVMDAAPVFFEDIRGQHADTRPEGRTPWLTPITVRDLEGDLEHLVHHDVTLKFVCDRGVSHELVRHRAASFAQESTRYCNYSSGKYGAEITVVRPSWCVENSSNWLIWKRACKRSEYAYMALIASGAAPQEARAVLSNSLKTEVIMTGTIGHWMHFLGLRCGPEAQPDMREVACMARDLLANSFSKFERRTTMNIDIDSPGFGEAKKKLFISCPMKGRTEEAIRHDMDRMHKLAEIVFDQELEVIPTYIEHDPPATVNQAVYYLGASIQKLAEADYLIGIDHCETARGCNVEAHIARSYGIPSTYVCVREFMPDVAEMERHRYDNVYADAAVAHAPVSD